MSNSTKLTGNDLLDFIEANKDHKTKTEMAMECGYVRIRGNGEELANFTDFYASLMEAKGITPRFAPNPYQGRDIKDLLLEKGFTQLNVTYDPNMNGFVILDENSDSLEDDDLSDFLQDELWEKLEDSVGNNIFGGVVNVSDEGMTFTGDVCQPVSYADLSLV